MANFTHISTATTTNITAVSPGITLLAVVFNTFVISTACTISDGTPGTTIGVVTIGTGLPTGPITNTYGPMGLTLTTNNIRVVTTGAWDITVIWQ